VAQLVGTLRYNRKVADSCPNDVVGIFQCQNPTCSTMALGSARPLNRNKYFLGGKGLRVPIVPKSGSLKLLASSESAQGFLCIFYLTFKEVDMVTSFLFFIFVPCNSL